MAYAFSSADGSVFECALDFGKDHYANVNFLDTDRSDIPLHLSFRFRRQVMMHNQRQKGQWAREDPTPVVLEESGNRLRVEFENRAAAVFVNGVKIARIGLPSWAHGNDAATHWVGFSGGVVDIRLSGEAHENRRGRGVLTMDSPFRLDGWAFDPASDEQELAIVLEGVGETLPMVALPVPEIAREQQSPVQEIGVVGLVPGWIWTKVPASAETVEIQLLSNDRPCGPSLVLSRTAVVAVIEGICERGPGAGPFELLSAIEHVRFGGLGDKLSPSALAVIEDAVRRYKVDDFMHTPGQGKAGGTEGVGQTEASRAAQAALTQHRNPVVDRLKVLAPRIAKAVPDEMIAVLKEVGFRDLAENEQRGYFLSVTSGFCSADRFEPLFAVVEQCGLDAMPVGQGDWTSALVLPYFYLREDAAALISTMQRVETIEGWLDYPALCWTVKRVIAEAPTFLNEAQREDIIDIFLRRMERSQAGFFGPGPSEDLVTTMVVLIEHVATLTEDLQAWATDRALWVFGLSQRFWTALEEREAKGGVTLSPALADGRDRFARLRSAIASGDFETAAAEVPSYALDAPRFRRELAAAAQHGGMPVRDALDINIGNVVLGTPESDEALVRHLAFPCESEERPELARMCRGALRRLNRNIPRSYHPETQRDAAEAARALLKDPPRDEGQLTEALDGLFPQLRRMASARSDFLGPAIAVSLLSGATIEGQAGLAKAVAARLAIILNAMSDEEISSLHNAPAFRMALYGLRQIHARRPSAATQDLLDRFIPVLGQLPPLFEDTPARPDFLLPETGVAAFHDILVVVYSCLPNLETRIPALRKAWLDDLAARGIPYIIVVGDGDGRRDGEVVHLDAPDSYEALPSKTVAMAEWVLNNTPYSHVFKVDDDCFLDVDEAIGGLSYRKYPYYGRALVRREGETDRIWHHARGSKSTACMEIDKSSEPSEYADGGSGYVLNRRAMRSLVEASKSARGAWLRLVSFMEDKLVGDTLALAGIKVKSLDYHVCILRRNRSEGMSVCRWENAFLPSEATPTQLAHLDAAGLQPMARKVQNSCQLRPLRVWPTFEPARLGWNNLNVELISSLDTLQRVNAEPLCVVGCMRNEIDMLPMFLKHYRGIGAKGFLLIDNCSDDGTLEYLYAQPDVAVFSADADYGVTEYGVAWQQALMANLRMNRWSLVADADEFLMLPKAVKDLSALLQRPDFAEADVARILMLDLYPKGALSSATLGSGDPFAQLDHCDAEPFLSGWTTGPYGNAETWTSALRHRLLEGSRRELFVAQKYALIRYRPWLRFSAGLHYAAEARVAATNLVFAHFKYHAAFHERARIETQRGQHFNNAEEYRRYLALMAEGRDVIYDPAVSVPWRKSAAVARLLGR